MTTLTYDNATEALPHLMKHVLLKGDVVPSRNGTTRELPMVQIRLLRPFQPEVLTPHRGTSLPAQIAETMWVLSGRNDAEWLSHYLPRALDFSDDGKTWRGGYGPRLRAFGAAFEFPGVDQLKHVIDLLNEDRSTRRALINIYDPLIDTEPGKDIPCNNWLHFLPREGRLHLNVTTRSNDLMWGWSGINAFEWTVLLHVVAGMTGFKVGTINFNISSLHLYERHWAKARRIADGASEGAVKSSPGFRFSGTLGQLDDLFGKWFKIEEQIRKGGLSDALLGQVHRFPEPMMRSWLLVLLAWHHDDPTLMGAVEDTALGEGLKRSPKRRKANEVANPSVFVTEVANGQLVQEGSSIRFNPAQTNDRAEFTQFLTELHDDKHKAYGDSWKKRGELFSIMSNVTRKVDRLGVAGGGDTSADTAIDLLVYLIKYDIWLDHNLHRGADLTEGVAHRDEVAAYLCNLALLGSDVADEHTASRIAEIKVQVEYLESLVTKQNPRRQEQVRALARETYKVALNLWRHEQQHAKQAAANATRPFNGYATAGDNE